MTGTVNPDGTVQLELTYLKKKLHLFSIVAVAAAVPQDFQGLLKVIIIKSNSLAVHFYKKHSFKSLFDSCSP